MSLSPGTTTRSEKRALRWRWRIAQALVALALLAPLGAFAAPLELSYHLRLMRPTTHLVEIEIEARNVTTPTLDCVLPAWSPGRYAIYDFAKNVQEFQASGADGKPLAWTKTDKQTWRVEGRAGGGQVRVRYKVFANDLNGSFSQFDTSHANLNGASIFMYVDGHKSDPLTLDVEIPQGWKVYSGFSLALDDRSFQARSYDVLIDTPMEICPDCAVDTFRWASRTFRVVVHSYPHPPAPGDLLQLKVGLAKLVRSETAMMPPPDFEHYTFLIHFAPDISMGDGMEHLNSTQIIVRGGADAAGVQEALETAAHEFFHLWNVKRLRPAALGPFDYTHEDYTRSLWFAEGVTSYYAYVHMLRSGLWSRDEFLKRLTSEIQGLDYDPGRKLMSAESSSFNAWFYDRAPQMQETNFANTTISYYNKGALLGLLLDLEIRGRTGGAKSLDDVLRLLYQAFYDAPAATPYGPGRGYEESDLLKAINQVSGSDFSSFFERYVRGTDPLPYAEALGYAGLALQVGVAPGSPPSLGIRAQQESNGARIREVVPGSAGDRAGLSRDDLILDVDGVPLSLGSLSDRLRIYAPGVEVPLTVERHGRDVRVVVKLDPPVNNRYAIVETSNASPQQVKIRDEWLAHGD